MVFQIGRLCVKIAGRDANLKCVIVDVIDDNTVLIDGQTRRRKCNKRHLEPLDVLIKIKKNASHSDVAAEFKKINVEIVEKKAKKAGERPLRIRKKKAPRIKQDSSDPAKGKPKKEALKKKEAKTEAKMTLAKGEGEPLDVQKSDKPVRKEAPKKKSAPSKEEKKKA